MVMVNDRAVIMHACSLSCMQVGESYGICSPPILAGMQKEKKFFLSAAYFVGIIVIYSATGSQPLVSCLHRSDVRLLNMFFNLIAQLKIVVTVLFAACVK